MEQSTDFRANYKQNTKTHYSNNLAIDLLQDFFTGPITKAGVFADAKQGTDYFDGEGNRHAVRSREHKYTAKYKSDITIRSYHITGKRCELDKLLSDTDVKPDYMTYYFHEAGAITYYAILKVPDVIAALKNPNLIYEVKTDTDENKFWAVTIPNIIKIAPGVVYAWNHQERL